MEGKIEKLLDGNKSDDYLSITLLDREPILDAMGKLREVYPNVLHIDRPFLTPSGDVHGGADHRKMGDTELFAAFFSQVTGDELTVPENKAFSDVVDALRKRDREAAL
jgi:exonuclease SbcD